MSKLIIQTFWLMLSLFLAIYSVNVLGHYHQNSPAYKYEQYQKQETAKLNQIYLHWKAVNK